MSQNIERSMNDIIALFQDTWETMTVDEQYQILQSIIATSNGFLKWRIKSWLEREPTPDLLTLLPPEIQMNILRMVDGASLLSACQVSKAWNNILKSHTQLWKEKSIEMGVNIKLKPPELSWKSAFSLSRQQLFRIETGMAFKEKFVNLQNCKKSVKALDYRDGYLCAVSDEDCINIWQLELNIPVLSFTVLQKVSCIKFIPKFTLVCGHFTGILTSWDLSTMSDYDFQQFNASPLYNSNDRDFAEFSLLKAKFKMHSGPVFSCDFSEKLQLLVSGSADETVKFWCLRTGQILFTMAFNNHWILRVILVPFSGTDSRHSLITMTRESVDRYDWYYNKGIINNENCSYEDLRGDYSILKHFSKVKLNQNNDNFITPGLQMSQDYIGLVKQDLQEKQAHLLVLNSDTFKLFKAIPLNFKVRKLLALGNRYALLLTVGKILYTSSLIVVDIITGDKVGSHTIPHSKMTTPDGAQIIVGDTEWLNGLSGWSRTFLNQITESTRQVNNEDKDSSLAESYHSLQSEINETPVRDFYGNYKNLVLAAGIKVDVGRVFTLWWKEKKDDDKRKLD